METQKLTWGTIKVNKLNRIDQKLAYQNHIEQFKERNLKPEKKEEFLNQNVARCFKFGYSNEGHSFWFQKLNEIAQKENRKQEYLKEKKSFYSKSDFVLAFVLLIISVILFFFALLSIFNK